MPPVISPFNPPVMQPSRTPAAPPAGQARAAQRAFFQQAMGDSTPVRTAPSVSAPVIARPAVQTASAPAAAPQPARVLNRQLPDEPPARFMRPGSFVDVKI